MTAIVSGWPPNEVRPFDGADANVVQVVRVAASRPAAGFSERVVRSAWPTSAMPGRRVAALPPPNAAENKGAGRRRRRDAGAADPSPPRRVGHAQRTPSGGQFIHRAVAPACREPTVSRTGQLLGAGPKNARRRIDGRADRLIVQLTPHIFYT